MLKELLYSVSKPSAYVSFLDLKKGRIFLFGLIIVFINVLLGMIIPIATSNILKNMTTYLEEDFPDFSYFDGRLRVEGKFEFDEDGMYILMDTSEYNPLNNKDNSREDIKKMYSNYESVLILGEKSAFIHSNTSTQFMNYKEYESLLGNSFSKTELISRISIITIIILVLFSLIYFIVKLAGYFIGALIFAAIGLIINSIVKGEFYFGQLYRFSVHAMVLSYLISALLSLFRFNLPWLISAIITLAYLTLAIVKSKEDYDYDEDDNEHYDLDL